MNDEKNKSCKKGIYIFTFFVLLILYVAVYKIFGLYYAINDDTTMQKLAAGTITGTPDAHLIFIKYPIGLFISGLFRLMPGWDWYGIVMTGIILLCIFLVISRIIYLTIIRQHNIILCIIGILISLYLLLDSLILFQFTLTAGIVGTTALFFLVTSRDKIETYEYVVAWLLLLVAAMYRTSVFYMTVPLAIVLITIKTGRFICSATNEKCTKLAKKKDILLNNGIMIRLICFAAACMALYFGIKIVEDKAYSSDRWKKYMEYKHARSMITDYYDYPSYDENIAFWESIDISKEEHSCLKKMYGLLPDFNGEKMVMIADYAQSIQHEKDLIKERIPEMANLFLKAMESVSARPANVLLALLFVLLLFYLPTLVKNVRLNVVLCFFVTILELVYLLYKGRLPARVVQVFDYQSILLILGLTCSSYGKRKLLHERTSAGLIIIAGMVALLLWGGNQKVNQVNTCREKLAAYQEQTSFLHENEDKLFIVPTGTFTSAKQFTFHDQTNQPSNSFGTAGWSVYSPWNDIRYKEKGLNPHSNLLLNENIYMLCTKLADADKLNAYYFSIGVIDEDYKIEEKRQLMDGRTLYTIKWTSKN